jgi:hypothetical protein
MVTNISQFPRRLTGASISLPDLPRSYVAELERRGRSGLGIPRLRSGLFRQRRPPNESDSECGKDKHNADNAQPQQALNREPDDREDHPQQMAASFVC